MSEPSSKKRVEREARLKYVPLGKMKINPVAQRDLNPARVDHLVATLDLEQVGTPTVNERDGSFWVIDGQHRIEALKAFGFGPDDVIQCWTYVGLTEDEEAERFLKLNDYLAVRPMARFRAAVTAGRARECDIDRIVRSQGLVVSDDKVENGVAAVATITKIYDQADGPTLGRALRIAFNSFGKRGLDAAVIGGIGLLCQRYNGELDESYSIQKLASIPRGAAGLLQDAERTRTNTGNAKAQCVAAAAVEAINKGRGGPKKLRTWWKDA